MRSEWIDTTIGDQIQLQRGVDITKRDFKQGTIPVVSSGGIGGFHDTFTGVAPGVILGRKGLVGSVYYLPTDYWAHDTTLWVKDFKGNHPKYVYYFFRSIAATLRDLDVGSANPTLNRNHVHPIETRWAPIDEQKAIAHILGTIDDKIELNRKTNETLEAMAKALFKSWFVDFDPVRAKAEGRPIGLPAKISDLFPDSFEDSELGETPSGWRVHPLSDIFSIQGGSQPPATTFVDFPGNGYVRLLQIRDFLGDNHLTYVPESKNLRIVGEDDVLIGRYGSGSGKFMDDSLGRPLRGLSGAINVAVVKTLPRQNNMIEMIYCMVLSGWFYRQIVGGSSRAVQAGFRKEDLDLIPFPMPPNSILDAFQEIGNNFWHRTKALDVQTKSLCQIRATLLPKLISGEIRIPDAEKLLEEVGV
jgi:type I restriction enzyme S subunit